MGTKSCSGFPVVHSFVLGVITVPSYIEVFAQSNAGNLYASKSMPLNQPKDQYPFIDQAYIPQNKTVSVGTAVTWFNADVDLDSQNNSNKRERSKHRAI